MPHSENICHDCNIEMTERLFNRHSVFYCESCGNYKTANRTDNCDHDYEPILFVQSDGSEVVKKWCKKCNMVTNALPKASFDLSKLRKRVYANYTDWYYDWLDNDNIDYKNFINALKEKQHEFIGMPDEISAMSRLMVYDEYIHSDEWKVKRNKILTRDDYECQICSVDATDVHHLSYAHFKREYDFELISLCKPCHINRYHPWKKYLLDNNAF